MSIKQEAKDEAITAWNARAHLQAPERDQPTWDTLAAEFRAAFLERDELKRRIAGMDCTKCGCARQSSERKQLIYIASPYGGREENYILSRKILTALQECRKEYAFVSPIQAYGYYYDPASYDKGIEMCLDLLSHCDQLWIIGDDGISKGVQIERQWAQEHGMAVKEYATLLDATGGEL